MGTFDGFPPQTRTFLRDVAAHNEKPWFDARRVDPQLLKRYREAVVDDTTGAALAKAVKAVEGAGLEVLGERYSRPPAGFKTDGDAARLLRHGALWTIEEAPADAVSESPAIIEHCMAHWRAALPLHRWLVDTLQRR